jgi:FixJ family two-component response regulator
MKKIARVSGGGEGLKDSKRRVFVVDDDASVRKSLATLLSTQEYAVETFASAAEYLEHVPSLGPACLVLDVRLPGLDGPALKDNSLKKAEWSRSSSSPVTATYRWESVR